MFNIVTYFKKEIGCDTIKTQTEHNEECDALAWDWKWIYNWRNDSINVDGMTMNIWGMQKRLGKRIMKWVQWIILSKISFNVCRKWLSFQS